MRFSSVLCHLLALTTVNVVQAQTERDVCRASDEFDVPPPGSPAIVVSGSTTGPYHSSTGAIISGDAWHKFDGTGNVVKFNVCDADFDSRVYVNLHRQCTGGCSGLCYVTHECEVELKTMPGQGYSLRVYGAGSPGSGHGNYNLVVSSRNDFPENDVCWSNEIDASTDGSVTFGTTTGATDDFPYRGSTANESPGVWYSLPTIAPQQWFTVDMCGTGFEGARVVPMRSCSAYPWLSTFFHPTGYSSDDGCAGKGERYFFYQFFPFSGVDYRLLITGDTPDQHGDFSMRTELLPRPENDVCVDRTLISNEEINDPVLIEGTTVGASNFGLTGNFGDSISGNPSAWYEVVGDGSTFTARICGAYDTSENGHSITVYEDGCEGTVKAESYFKSGGCAGAFVSWNTKPCEVYIIQVHTGGDPFNWGNFELDISSNKFNVFNCDNLVLPPEPTIIPPPPDNDECVDAILLPIPSTVTATTLGATHEQYHDGTSCRDVDVSAPGVWYEVVGDGSTFIAHTCAKLGDIDTQISVFSACGNPMHTDCLDASDDKCGFGSAVIWRTEECVRYKILVHANPDSVLASMGEFTLQVTPENLWGSALVEAMKDPWVYECPS